MGCGCGLFEPGKSGNVVLVSKHTGKQFILYGDSRSKEQKDKEIAAKERQRLARKELRRKQRKERKERERKEQERKERKERRRKERKERK